MKKSISNMVIQRLYFVHCIIMSNYALVSLSRYVMPSDKRFFFVGVTSYLQTIDCTNVGVTLFCRQ